MVLRLQKGNKSTGGTMAYPQYILLPLLGLQHHLEACALEMGRTAPLDDLDGDDDGGGMDYLVAYISPLLKETLHK